MAGLEAASGRDVAQHRVGRVILRQPGRHRGGRPAGQDRHARGTRAARARRRWPTPGSPTSCSSSGSTRRARWAALQARGARPQRPLWASTSVKDPSFADTMYVTELAAPGTVNTMPEATIHATADHAQLHGDAIHGTYDESRQVFAQLEALGVHYDDVVQVLEDEGVREVRRLLERAARHHQPRDGRGRQHYMIPNPLRDPRDRRIPRLAGPCVLVLFGVTGDLASKKLLPAIYDLANRGLLPPGFSLVGFARRELGGRGLRPDHPRCRQGARAHAVPRGSLAAAARGHPVRAGRVRRRRGLRQSGADGRRSWMPSAAPAGTTRSTCRCRRTRSRSWSSSSSGRACPARRRPVRPATGPGAGSSSRSRSATTWPAPAS